MSAIGEPIGSSEEPPVGDAVWQAPAWLRPSDASPSSAPASTSTTAPTGPAAEVAAGGPGWVPPPTTAAKVVTQVPTWGSNLAPSTTVAVASTTVAATAPSPRDPRITDLSSAAEGAIASVPTAGALGIPSDDDDDDEEFDDGFEDRPVVATQPATERPATLEPVTTKPAAEPRPKAKPAKDEDDDFDDDDDDEDDDDFGDDDEDDGHDPAASDFGPVTAAQQSRKLPWIPIVAVASTLVLISAFVFRDALFGPTEELSTDESAEVPEPEPEPAPEPKLEPDPVPEPKVEPKPPEPPPPAIPTEELDAKIAEATNLVNRFKHADATKIVDEILGKMPKEPRALALRALVQLEKRKYEEALGTATDCIDADAKQALCWITIAIVEQDQNDNFPRALEAYRKYLELAPEGPYASSAKTQIERLSAKVEG